MISSGINLVMTVIGFSVSVMFIVFVCTRLICARIHLNSSRRFPLVSRSDLSILERGLHGLEPAIVASFPLKKYNDEFFSSCRDAQCSICLGEYHSDDVLRILPFCGHAFHVTCIDIWLHQHNTCPVCRISLRDLLERKQPLQPFCSSGFRYNYGPGCFEAPSYSYLMAGDRISSATCDAHGINNSIEDDCQASHGDGPEVQETIGTTAGGTPTMITKDPVENKHVEIVSNP